MTGRVRRRAACVGLAALALTTLALTACGKKSPPVAPEQRAPQSVTEPAGVVDQDSIVVSWVPTIRRADNTRLRESVVMRLFRVEDGGAGEPKSAMLADGRIAGYEEITSIRSDEPQPAVRRGTRLVFTDRKGLALGRRYTYVVLAGDAQGRIGPPSRRVSVTYAAAPAEPDNFAAEPHDRAVRLSWSAPVRLLDGSAVTDALQYEVLRAPSADGELAAVTPPVSASTLTDSNLENDLAYYYAVRAVRVTADTTVYGRPSARLAATPRDVTPPAPPANLVGIPSEGAVRLSWSPSPEPDVIGYIVYRAPVGGIFERIGSISTPSTTFVDRAVPRGAYRYAVTAYDRAARPNESGRSNEVGVSLP
ncbi:MAG: fibronectin type III domain-containing protein [Candidatus Rokuibacteriota bacterium]